MTAAEDGFTPLEHTTIPRRRETRAITRTRSRRFGDHAGYEVVLSEGTVRQLLALAHAAAPCECMGLVVGEACEDDTGRHDLVLGFVLDTEALAQPSGVQTTPASEVHTRTLVRQLHPGSAILGWFHSHVRCGARYSATDRTNQATWPDGALGIVVDPDDPEELGVYRGRDAQRLHRLPEVTAANADRSFTPLLSEPRVVTTMPVRPAIRAVRSRATSLPWVARVAIAAAVVLGVANYWRTRRIEIELATLTRLAAHGPGALASASATPLDRPAVRRGEATPPTRRLPDEDIGTAQGSVAIDATALQGAVDAADASAP